MICCLCHTDVNLFDLDPVGYHGLPAHRACAEPVRALAAEVLAEAEALILADPDPRHHRHHRRPPATTAPG